MKSFSSRPALYGAAVTVLTLFGGLLLGVVAGEIVFEILPGHTINNPDPLHILLAALPALVGMMLGSGLWGVWMGRLARASHPRRMMLAGALGFAPITIVLGIALSVLEPIAVEQFGAQLPVRHLFTLFFVPTAFLIAGVSAWAIGIGLQNRALAMSLLWRVGLAAALAFLVVNLVMEAFGWQVGAPLASERFTMLTVAFASDLGAALAGGAALGLLLKTERRLG